MIDKIPRIGISTIILHPEEKFYILMGRRKGSHGHGTWSFPGGHLEFEESIIDCSIREAWEETGLELKFPEVTPYLYTENLFPEFGKHYITIYSLAEALSVQPILKEPEKCYGWEWVNWYDLTGGRINPLFSPIPKLLNIFDLPFEYKNYFTCTK